MIILVLQVNHLRLKTIQQKAMAYLERQNFQHLAQYPLAVTTYALSKAGSRHSGTAFDHLKKVAKNKSEHSFPLGS